MESKEIIEVLKFFYFCEDYTGLVSAICKNKKITKNKFYKLIINNPDIQDLSLKFKKDFDNEYQKLKMRTN